MPLVSPSPSAALLTQEWRERIHAPPMPAVRYLAINHVTARGTLRYGEHRHHEYELILVKRGIYRAQIADQEIIAHPGDVVIVQPGEIHNDAFTRGVVIIGVNLRLIAPSILPLLLRPNSPRVRQAPPGTAQLMTHMQQVATSSDASVGGLLDALAGQLFWTTAAMVLPHERDPQWIQRGTDARFLAALEQMFHCHVNRRLAVGTMAKIMGLGSTALTAHCRRLLGRSPAAAHVAWRLERADEMLRTASSTVEVVATQFGFANAFHFSRSFRAHFGYPPSHAGHPERATTGATDGRKKLLVPTPRWVKRRGGKDR